MSGEHEWRTMHCANQWGVETWTFGEGGPKVEAGTYLVKTTAGIQFSATVVMEEKRVSVPDMGHTYAVKTAEPWVTGMGMRIPVHANKDLLFRRPDEDESW
jgi:hypothetical protein